MKQVTKNILTLALVPALALVCLSSASAVSENLVGRRTAGMVGVKGGFISRGKVRNELLINTKIGNSVQVFADLPIARGFLYTVAFDFNDIKMSRDHQWMIDGSLALKYVIRSDDLKMEFKPYAAAGIGFLGDIYIFDRANFWTMKLGFETHFEVNPKRFVLFELAVLKAFPGPDNDYDSAIGPVYLFRAGIGLR